MGSGQNCFIKDAFLDALDFLWDNWVKIVERLLLITGSRLVGRVKMCSLNLITTTKLRSKINNLHSQIGLVLEEGRLCRVLGRKSVEKILLS